MRNRKKARKTNPENAPEGPERGKKANESKTEYGIGVYIGIILALAGSAFMAWCWFFKVSDGKMGIGDAIASVVGLATVIGLFLGKGKLRLKWKGLLAYVVLACAGLFCVCILTFGTWTGVRNKNASEADNTLEPQEKSVLVNENERNFQQMPFDFAKDVLVENLEYYIDGQKISNEDRKYILHTFFKGHIQDGLPEKYESDEEKLNSGLYAKFTTKANAYFNSYKAVKDYNIEAEDKLLLASKARKYRKDANGEYVTEDNSWNLIWESIATRDELLICIADSTDEDEIREWKVQMKESNRDVMNAAWNILRIRYFFNKTVDAIAKEKLVEAYQWERDHMPESGVDYDALIGAVEKLDE